MHDAEFRRGRRSRDGTPRGLSRDTLAEWAGRVAGIEQACQSLGTKSFPNIIDPLFAGQARVSLLVPIATRKKLPPTRPTPDRGFGVLDLSVVIADSSTGASQSGWRFRRVSITPLVLFHTFIRRKCVLVKVNLYSRRSMWMRKILL